MAICSARYENTMKTSTYLHVTFYSTVLNVRLVSMGYNHSFRSLELNLTDCSILMHQTGNLNIHSPNNKIFVTSRNVIIAIDSLL